MAKDVDFEKIARRTPGFTGADLQNLMNEAAILAARRELKEISKDEISDALERIIAGPEKKNAVVSDEKKKLVAYHGKYLLLFSVVAYPPIHPPISIYPYLPLFLSLFLSPRAVVSVSLSPLIPSLLQKRDTLSLEL